MIQRHVTSLDHQSAGHVDVPRESKAFGDRHRASALAKSAMDWKLELVVTRHDASGHSRGDHEKT
jgi:hypothetical protein